MAHVFFGIISIKWMQPRDLIKTVGKSSNETSSRYLLAMYASQPGSYNHTPAVASVLNKYFVIQCACLSLRRLELESRLQKEGGREREREPLPSILGLMSLDSIYIKQ